MMARSNLMEVSLSCFHWGMAALVPVIGFLAAPVALVRFRRAVVETNDRWNPARAHLYLGMVMALLSLLAHCIVGFVIYLQVIRSVLNG